MYKRIPLKNVSHEDWLRLRKSGIGGSDAGAVLGVNPYSSQMQVFLEKTSNEIMEKAENEAIRVGHDLEQYVADRFTEATGKKVRRTSSMFRSEDHTYMLADIDRFIVGEDAGLECKTASAYSKDVWQDGQIPMHYLIQCYHYMAVTGKRKWYIACVILGIGFVYRELEWNDDLIQRIVRVEEDFWNNHVLKGIMPSPDGSEGYEKALNQYYTRAETETTIPLVGFDEKLKRREELVEQIGNLETEQKQIEQEVKLYMKDNEFALSPAFRVRWSNVESTKLDTKRLRTEQPEIYKDYGKKTVTRRFTVSAA